MARFLTTASPRWRACIASTAGSSHERRSLPNQDASGYRITADGILLAVSDGAGSAPYSAEGSRRAVITALESLSQNSNRPAQQALEQAMTDAREAVIALAKVTAQHPRQYAATLSLAIVRDGKLTVAQTGDGAVAWASPERCFRLAAAPCRGEYANTTEFITDRGWRQPEATEVAAEVCRVLLTTDGMLDLAMKRLPDGSYKPYQPFHDALFQWLESRDPNRLVENYLQLRQLLRSPKTRGRTDDDVTLAIASSLHP